MDELDSFSALMGREFLLNQIVRPVTHGRINHAQIFAGPRGTGKSSAAYLLAKAVNCTGEGVKPCGRCPSCLRYSQGDPMNLTEVRPDGASIKVEQVRSVLDEVIISPDSGMKCVIFHDAETMTEQAQNALLKTLEEPPAYVLFMLLTESYTALLPTIRSRCMVLRFAPIETDKVAAFLESKGIDKISALEAARAGSGSPGKALEIARNADYKQLTDALINAFSALRNPKDVAQCCTAFRSKSLSEKADAIIEMLEICASEMMPAQESRTGEVGRLSRVLMDNGIDGVKLMQATLKCSQMLKSNVAFQSAIEMLMYDMTAP